MPLPGSTSSSFSLSLFHFARECTTTACCSSIHFTGNFTGLSTPFKSSLIPVPSSTIRGDDTLTRFNCLTSSFENISFTSVIASSRFKISCSIPYLSIDLIEVFNII